MDIEKKIREIENEIVDLRVKLSDMMNEWIYVDEKLDELEEACVFSDVEKLKSEIEELKKEIIAIRIILKQLIDNKQYTV